MSRTTTSKTGTAQDRTLALASSAAPSTFGDRIYLRFGKLGTTVIHRLVSAALLGLVLFADYLIVLFTAVNVLPNIAVLIQHGTGVTLEARMDAVIAGWLIPVLFIAAAVLVAEIFLMRKLWRSATDVTRRLRRSLFRLADVQKQASPAAGNTKPRTREPNAAAAS